MPGEDLSRQYNKLEVKPNLVQNSSLEETLDRCLQREFKQYGIRAEILRVGCRTGERPDRGIIYNILFYYLPKFSSLSMKT